MHITKLVTAAMLAATATFTSVLQATAESVCTLSDSETCAVDTLTPSDDDGSVLIYPGGNTRCAFDDYTDSVTTFSTNSTYFFQVFPNGGSDKSKLMIFFQGGGACTDKETCSFGLQCSLRESATLTTAATSSNAGVLNRSISDNMFKDWNIVFIPYCTGDVHVGNRVVDPYDSSVAELLGEPQCLGLNYTMYLNGYNNTQAVLNWALENYPDVDNLVVGGESAGSLGAQLHSAHIAELWEVGAKGTRYSVIADSYVGAVPANHTGSQSLHFTGACDVNLGLPATVVADCDAETASTLEMTESLIEAELQGNWLFINSKGDLVQRYFYALLDEGIEGYPFTDLVSEDDFYDDMSTILDAYHTVSSRITTFYVEGTKHVFLADSNFTSYESDEGLLLGDVINECTSRNSERDNAKSDGDNVSTGKHHFSKCNNGPQHRIVQRYICSEHHILPKRDYLHLFVKYTVTTEHDAVAFCHDIAHRYFPDLCTRRVLSFECRDVDSPPDGISLRPLVAGGYLFLTAYQSEQRHCTLGVELCAPAEQCRSSGPRFVRGPQASVSLATWKAHLNPLPLNDKLQATSIVLGMSWCEVPGCVRASPLSVSSLHTSRHPSFLNLPRIELQPTGIISPAGTMHITKLVTAAMLAATATFTSVLQATAESVCTLSDSETCAVDTLTPSDDDGSVLIYPGGNTRCAFDDYTDSVTTFSTNSTYFFQVFPNGGSDKSKLMIFFQGGGACTDKETCSFGLQCSLRESATLTTAATSSNAGVLNRSISDNMFKDWNIVFIPYCTGDVHVGNRVVDPYDSSVAELLGEPQCLGLNYTMYLNGYNNTQAVLNWALENYPDVDNLVVGGESAGSLGAQLHSAHIAELWEVGAKGTRYSVIADSYVGAVPANHTGSQSLHFAGACDVNLGLPATVVANCDAETASIAEMTESLIEAELQGNWLFINSKGDLVQRYFYALLEEGIEGYPFTDLVSEDDFYDDMSTILDAYHTVSSRITTFYVEGTKHVFLADSNFTSYESDEGLLLGDVINAWLLSNTSLNAGTSSEATTAPPTTSNSTLLSC